VRVVFWGTPEFATPPLAALLGEGFDVVGVVTQPDRPQGRSRSTLVAPPVKALAMREHVPVLQPERPRGDEFLAELRALEPDVSVVVAYGHILPREVIDLPRLGTLNIHASLLPRWRGAAPIQAALLAGDVETGVSIMRMVPKLDAGPVLLRSRLPILDDETYGELQLRLSEQGALALIEALALLDLGGAVEMPQDESRVTFAPKIERDDARLDWSRPAAEVARRIRAFDPKPGAFTTLGAAELKCFGARLEPGDPSAEPGAIVDVSGAGMLVACDDAAVRIADVQQSGKRRMHAAEWMRGSGVREGETLG
jgi:methionyl-tRNA formyltransferase